MQWCATAGESKSMLEVGEAEVADDDDDEGSQRLRALLSLSTRADATPRYPPSHAHPATSSHQYAHSQQTPHPRILSYLSYPS